MVLPLVPVVLLPAVGHELSQGGWLRRWGCDLVGVGASLMLVDPVVLLRVFFLWLSVIRQLWSLCVNLKIVEMLGVPQCGVSK